MTENGKFIVIEGTDGSGKATQIELLTHRLQEHNYSYQVIDFPRYKDNPYGRVIKEYLNGEYGTLYEVHPKLASIPYAIDRLLAKPLIEKWRDDGSLVIANRYVSANKAHMAAKLPIEERDNFIRWLDELEYETNRIPRPDLTILLYLPVGMAQSNVDRKGYRDYLNNKIGRDIHEDNLKYQGDTADIFLRLAKSEPNWEIVECATQISDWTMKVGGEIHFEIMNVLKRNGILRYG